MKTLISERLCLRPVTTRDFPAMAAIDSDPGVMRYLRLKSPVPTYDQALEEQRPGSRATGRSIDQLPACWLRAVSPIRRPSGAALPCLQGHPAPRKRSRGHIPLCVG